MRRAAPLRAALLAAAALAPAGMARAQEPLLEALPRAAPAAPPAAEAAEVGDAAAEATRQGELRLRLLRARLDLLTGRHGAAREAYEALRADMPGSAEPLAGLAAVARETGRPRLAHGLASEALRIEPGHAPSATLAAALDRAAARRLRGDVERRIQRGGIGAGRADVTLAEAGVQWGGGKAWRFAATQGAAWVEAEKVRRVRGPVRDPVRDVSAARLRTELSATYEAPGGETLAVSVFANDEGAGAGLVARRPDDHGATALRVEYRRPAWDFVEGILDGVVRDRLALERVHRFVPGLTGRVETGVNRYGVPRDDGDLARSVTLRGELRAGDVAGVEGLSLSYVLDAEYLRSETFRADGAGRTHRALPVVDREVHAGLLGYGGSAGSPAEGRVTWQASAGYGTDRYGRSGPVGFLAVGYAREGFELALRAGHLRNIGRSQGETTILGASLAWIF